MANKIKDILDRWWEVIVLVDLFCLLAEGLILIGVGSNIFLTAGILLFSAIVWFIFWAWVTIEVKGEFHE